MKNLVLLIVALVCPLLIHSQTVIDKYYQNYKEREDITEVYVSGRLFQLASNFVDENEVDEDLGNVKEFITAIQEFNLIAVPDMVDAKSVYRDGIRKISNSHDPLVQFREKENQFAIFVDEYDGVVEELVGIGVEENNKFIVFSLLGQIDLDKVGELISKIRDKDKHTDQILGSRNFDVDKMKMYPNPVSANATLNVEVPEGMVGGKMKIYDMNGSLLRTQDIKGGIEQIETDEFTSGYYVVELQHDDVTIKKRVMVTE